MSLDNIKNAMPDYAKDIKLNLSSLANEEILNEQQKWGTMLASAIAGRNATVIAEISNEAREHLSDEAFKAAQAAAAIMGMNNVYYRFVHLASNKDYQSMPAKLRMNILANPGVDKTDFELWSLAVSAINACGMCIDAHENTLKQHNIGTEHIQAAVRIASVIHAASGVMDGEEAMNNEGAMQQAA